MEGRAALGSGCQGTVALHAAVCGGCRLFSDLEPVRSAPCCSSLLSPLLPPAPPPPPPPPLHASAFPPPQLPLPPPPAPSSPLLPHPNPPNPPSSPLLPTPPPLPSSSSSSPPFCPPLLCHHVKRHVEAEQQSSCDVRSLNDGIPTTGRGGAAAASPRLPLGVRMRCGRGGTRRGWWLRAPSGRGTASGSRGRRPCSPEGPSRCDSTRTGRWRYR